MNNQVYYSDFYCKIYSIGMRIPKLYDYYEYYQSSRILDEDEYNQDLIDQHKKLGAYALDISNFIHHFRKFDILPDRLWLSNEKDDQPSDAEYIFEIKGGGIVMRENCANVFKQFRLGESTLTPLKIYELETGNLWSDETFYFFNLCEQRQFLEYPQSNDVLQFIQYPSGKKTYSNHGGIANDVIEVSKSATNCDIVIWHDDFLTDSIFISQSLHDALVQQEIYIPWNIYRCKTV